MKDILNSIVITVTDPKVVRIVTEPKFKKIAILKNAEGKVVNLKSHQLTRDLISFLETSGLVVEYNDAPAGCRGLSEINKIPVKVSPINHVNYDKGAIIKVPEVDNLSEENTGIVLKFLRKKGIDIKKHCSSSRTGTSCNQILGGEQ